MNIFRLSFFVLPWQFAFFFHLQKLGFCVFSVKVQIRWRICRFDFKSQMNADSTAVRQTDSLVEFHTHMKKKWNACISERLYYACACIVFETDLDNKKQEAIRMGTKLFLLFLLSSLLLFPFYRIPHQSYYVEAYKRHMNGTHSKLEPVNFQWRMLVFRFTVLFGKCDVSVFASNFEYDQLKVTNININSDQPCPI